MQKTIVTYATAEVAAEELVRSGYDKAFEENNVVVWDDGINIAHQRGAVVTFLFID